MRSKHGFTFSQSGSRSRMEVCSIAAPMLCLLCAGAVAHEATPIDAPAEGTLARELFGDDFGRHSGLKLDGYVQLGFVRNDASRSVDRAAGQSNYPIAQASDENFAFNAIELFFHRDLGGNIVPKTPPGPGPAADSFSWGFMVEGLYGRNGQAARTFGFDSSLVINHPGDQNPAVAKSTRQNFAAVPNLYAQLAIPYWQGIALTVGRFGPGLSYESPVQTKPSNNFLYSRTYAFVADPGQVTGVLLSANLARGEAGLWLGEIGVVNGWQNWEDNNSEKTIIAALRWRSADARTVANFGVISGDEENRPGSAPQLPNNRVLSPRGQLKRHAELNASHVQGPWKFAGEVLWGRQDGDGQKDTILLGPGGGPGFRGAHYSGVNFSTSYQVTPRWALEGRGEYFRDRDGFALYPTSSVKGDFFAVTFGAHYQLNKSVLFRPELRFDWLTDANGAKVFGDGRKSNQAMVAMDALIYF
jgi:Putative beta-barrel porin-2, OmpL-like. bbp2